jgi:hypothetical protein
MGRTSTSILAACCSLILSACVTTGRYENAEIGQFDGILLVMWVGETETRSGDGKFVFVPDPQRPLTFKRRNPDSTGGVIQPGVMYTDGGSIPRIGQLFNGLSPWGYAPAYMVHDWMFAARHCIVDGQDRPEYDSVREVDFELSGLILMEAIQTLVAERKVKENDVAASLIGAAVAGSQAKRYWDDEGACQQVSPNHMAAIGQALPSRSRSIFQQSNQLSRAAPVAASADILARIEF